MKNQNYQEELPRGVKYLIAIIILLIFLNIFPLIMLILYSAGDFSIISSYPKISLIYIIVMIIMGYFIYKGFREIKYWGWIIASIWFSIVFILNLISINVFLLPLNALYLWYLYIRRDFFKTGRIIRDQKFLKEEKIFKYLFWIFVVLVIIKYLLKLAK